MEYAILWAISLLAFGLFARRVRYLYRLVRLGRPEERSDQLGRRIGYLLSYVLIHPRLFRERGIGIAHLSFFWGFILYGAGFIWLLAKTLIPALPLPGPEEVGPVVLILEIFAVLVLIGLGVAAYRRYFAPPPHLPRAPEAVIILIPVALLFLTFIFFEGFSLAVREGSGLAPVFLPFGSAIARLAQEMPGGPAEGLMRLFRGLHLLIVLGFLVYIPYSKHLHLLASPFNVLFRARGPKGALPRPSTDTASGSGGEEGGGAARLGEFTWRELLNAFACAECGRCDRACPALASGLDLSPQRLVQALKDQLFEVGPGLLVGGNKASRPLVGESITPEELWACTTCLACMEECPVLNEHPSLIVRMRRHLVYQGEVDQRLSTALMNLSRYGNSFGQSARARGEWTEGLDFEVKDIREEPAEFLWFVGDFASYDPALQEITRITARVFHRAGLDFGILYDGERNAGGDVRRVGEEGLFELLVEENIAAMKECQFAKIITTDPHSYHTLKNEYPEYGGKWEVFHYTEVLDRLIREGRLPFARALPYRVTYHDPCYLGRYNGIYEPPRRILKALGIELVELPRSRGRSYCCGAGGGRIWMEEQEMKERPSESRVREALSLGVDYLVVSCPKDVSMFRDAIKTTDSEDRILIKELIELVEEGLTEE